MRLKFEIRDLVQDGLPGKETIAYLIQSHHQRQEHGGCWVGRAENLRFRGLQWLLDDAILLIPPQISCLR